MRAKIHHLESNDYLDWNDFEAYKSLYPYDDFGWFHVTVGTAEFDGGNDFQVCIATPKAVGRIMRSGKRPGILVDQFDAMTVRNAIYDRVESIEANTWEHIVEQLRKFMQWEYEGMGGA